MQTPVWLIGASTQSGPGPTAMRRFSTGSVVRIAMSTTTSTTSPLHEVAARNTAMATVAMMRSNGTARHGAERAVDAAT